jgi:hypothetical protein
VKPSDPSRRALVERYVKAFENADIAALAQLLTRGTAAVAAASRTRARAGGLQDKGSGIGRDTVFQDPGVFAMFGLTFSYGSGYFPCGFRKVNSGSVS